MSSTWYNCNGHKQNAAGPTADEDFMTDTPAAMQIFYHDICRRGLNGCPEIAPGSQSASSANVMVEYVHCNQCVLVHCNLALDRCL